MIKSPSRRMQYVHHVRCGLAAVESKASQSIGQARSMWRPARPKLRRRVIREDIRPATESARSNYRGIHAIFQAENQPKTAMPIQTTIYEIGWLAGVNVA